ncbi:MAG: glycoside hydrolase family 99-like domain-containing protein [Bacteroidaceae bacterium]|nr:glycoside hydrolase family 99-like domain-containing protein [Bacteroidaceae bacterium]
MKPRIIGLYLPQYHPIPENDEWWGPGFTEWNNVVKARPLFRGHYQPRLPADLGFYDLRLLEIREQQAALAREAGLEGFCYYHYWFGHGKQLLERPFNEVLASGKPDLPFCLCWANHDWTNKTWKKGSSLRQDSMIMQMHYDFEDHKLHFQTLLPAFRDPRYIKVDGKPIFAIWAPRKFPEIRRFIDLWQQMARENGLEGIHFIGYTDNVRKTVRDENGKQTFWDVNQAGNIYKEILDMGFDAVMSSGLFRAQTMCKGRLRAVLSKIGENSLLPYSYRTDYARTMKYYYVKEDGWENVYPTLLPQWDRTPRAGSKTNPLVDSTPEKFQRTVEEAIALCHKKQSQHQILFLKAWNEWGEGNYVEPDQRFGHGYLQALRLAQEKCLDK